MEHRPAKKRAAGRAPARGTEYVPGQATPMMRERLVGPQGPQPARPPAPASGPPAASDPLVEAVIRHSGGRPFPVTLITAPSERPGALGPLLTYLAGRLRARRPWGIADALVASPGLVASMQEAAERGDLEVAVRYLWALLFPEHPSPTGESLLLPLWNVDPADRSGWALFQALTALLTLAARRQRRVLYLLGTAAAERTQLMAGEFDLVVPFASLNPAAYDEVTAAALDVAAVAAEAPSERLLRLELPVARIHRRQDELALDVRAPDPDAPRGLGGALLARLGYARRDDEQLADFAHRAMLTTFRWDPLLQYVELSLLREERGVRRTVVEIKAERRGYPGIDSAAPAGRFDLDSRELRSA